MSESPTFRAVQKKTIRLMTFEDGLWDILLGLIFLALACYPVTRELLGPIWNMGLFLTVLVLLAIGQIVLRQIISVPRLGHVKPRRTPQLRFMLIFTAVMVILTLGLVAWTLLSPADGAEAASETVGSRSYVVELITIIVMGLIFSGLGFAAGVTRLYFYGWMVGLANLTSVYMTHNTEWTFLLPLAISAGIILIIGAAQFARFLQRYPSRTEAG